MFKAAGFWKRHSLFAAETRQDQQRHVDERDLSARSWGFSTTELVYGGTWWLNGDRCMDPDAMLKQPRCQKLPNRHPLCQVPFFAPQTRLDPMQHSIPHTIYISVVMGVPAFTSCSAKVKAHQIIWSYHVLHSDLHPFVQIRHSVLAIFGPCRFWFMLRASPNIQVVVFESWFLVAAGPWSSHHEMCESMHRCAGPQRCHGKVAKRIEQNRLQSQGDKVMHMTKVKVLCLYASRLRYVVVSCTSFSASA